MVVRAGCGFGIILKRLILGEVKVIIKVKYETILMARRSELMSTIAMRWW